MADKEKLQGKTSDGKSVPKLPINLEIGEEMLTEEGSIKLYNLLFNSKSNQKKKEFIKEALERFPNPDKTTDIEIDL